MIRREKNHAPTLVILCKYDDCSAADSQQKTTEEPLKDQRETKEEEGKERKSEVTQNGRAAASADEVITGELLLPGYWYDLARRREEERGKVTIRNGIITLAFDGSYQIQLDRIRTERDLLAWVLHLTDKPWMTSERLHVFVEKVATHRGFKLHGLR